MWLMGWSDFFSKDQKKLDAIEHQHISDEACLKAVVEAFLLGEGKHQPSWRMLIHRLHWAGESHLAETIKTNAEPHQGEWVSVWREMIRLTRNVPYLGRIVRAYESMTQLMIKPQGVILTNLFLPQY
jgi:hypothetical protein